MNLRKESIKTLVKRYLRMIDRRFPRLVFRSSNYLAAAVKWLGPGSQAYDAFQRKGFATPIAAAALNLGANGELPVETAAAMETRVNQGLEALILHRFYDRDLGQAWGVDKKAKIELVERIKTLTQNIPTATSWLFHVVLATEILNLPITVPGDVVECGCWKGGSTASLSLICSKVGRKLIVCDSFEGLPDDEPEVVHEYPHVGIYGYYQPGMYAAQLAEVQKNVAQYGDIAICEFVPGFFCDSLNTLTEPIAFAFLDVDLASSMKDCIKYLWPLMVDGGYVYTDDSCDMEVVRVWFDDAFWLREVGCRAPGYVGSGCGLPFSSSFSAQGYARKVINPERIYERVPWLYYPDSPVQGLVFR